MTPAQKALWFIESHLGQAITLDAVAGIGGITRFHMVRAFAAATGLPVMRYVRARRLTEAARALAQGAPDILSLALAADYGSHEAFTRAFRDLFGVPPEKVRAVGRLDHLPLQEAVTLDQTLLDTLEAPRFESFRPLLIAGIGERYGSDTAAGIPAQWQRFNERIDEIPARTGGEVYYGVCHNGDDAGNFDYIAGVEVGDFTDLPAAFARLRVAPQKYAVFGHRGHISGIRRTMNTIWNRWLPGSGFQAADAPMFERYGPEFDAHTGDGGFEIWIPVKG